MWGLDKNVERNREVGGPTFRCLHSSHLAIKKVTSVSYIIID